MRKRTVKKALESFAIVTASKEEECFFLQFKKDYRYRNLIVERVEAETLEDLIKKTQVVKLRNKYSKAWAVASLDMYKDKEWFNLEESLKEARRRKVGLCYAKPSILLYFALHFGLPGSKNPSESELLGIIKGRVPDFSWSVEYLRGKGSEFNWSLVKYKGVESSNEREFNKESITTGEVSDINFIEFLKDVALYCDEAQDLSYNQKSLS